MKSLSLPTRTLTALALALAAATTHAEPLLTSWFTQNSSVFARVIQTTSTSTGNKNITPVTTWPTSEVTNNNTSNPTTQSTTVYADVQRIRYDANYVYINSSGLASYTMGPFLSGTGGLFNFWPISQNYTCRITRAPALPTPNPNVKPPHQGGLIGMMVNGVGIYDLGDAFGFVQTSSSPVAGSDSMGQTNTTHPWWRDALAVEVVTFDPGFAHQPGNNGQYHYHAEPKALRYQLGDNMQATYDATNNTYSYTEDISNLHHSPILGWSFDGYPIYGPYGYSNPTNAGSTVTAMRSGFMKRDGTNGTTNLASTGRTTLPKWAAIAEGFATLANYSTQTLSNGDFVLSTATLYGPATTYTTSVPQTVTYSLGRYIGDYDFLGDRGQTQGPTGPFDLDQYNGRTCVTPEYPSGTYAYFVSVDASGNPAFPYMLGKQYYGTKNGGTSTGMPPFSVPPTGVTDFFNAGGTSLAETWNGSPAVNTGTGDVTLTWSSVEGGTYKVEATTDLKTWTTLNASVSASANTTLPAPAKVITTTSIVESGAALPATNTQRFYKVTRNP